MQHRVAELSTALREVSHGLHPAMLSQLGSGAALERLVVEFSISHNRAAQLHRPESVYPVPANVAVNLYRISQEALNNVARHAGPADAHVHLTTEREQVALVVVDTGAGFALETAKRGLGLISMRERAEAIGGTLHLESAPEKGTHVEVIVPLPQAF